MKTAEIKKFLLLKFKYFGELCVLHRWAIALALVVGFIYGMPQVIAIKSLGQEYQGVPYLVNDSEGEYLGRIHEILDGHAAVSSPVFREYKDSVSLIPPTGEYIFYYLPKLLTGLSLPNIIFLSRFLLPAIVYIFLYGLFYSINAYKTSSRPGLDEVLYANSGALFITLGAGVINYHDFINYLLHWESGPALLWLSRLVNPVTGMVLLSIIIFLLWKMFERKPTWPLTIFSAGIMAIMSGYVFSFALGLTISCLLSLYLLFIKDWKHALKIFIVPLTAIILNAIYFLGAISVLTNKSETSDPLKSGLFFTHVPTTNLVGSLVFLILLIAFVFYYRKEKALIEEKKLRWWWFIGAISIACLAVYFQQVITGIAVWPQHFAQYTVPLGMLICIILLQNLTYPRSRRLWSLGIFVLLLIVVISSVRSLLYINGTVPTFREQQTYLPVFTWLNERAPRDCVVYVSSDYANEINRFVNAFTSCNVYHSYYNYNGVPESRIMHNYLVNLRLRDVKLAEVKKHIEDNWFWMKVDFFRDWGDMFCCADPWLKKIKNQKEVDSYYRTVVDDIERRYASFLKGDLLEQLQKYQLDYFVVDTNKEPRINDKTYSFLRREYASGNFVIYSLQKSKN